MAGRDQKIAQLEQVPLFSSLSKKELAIVARHCDEVDVDAGVVLCREGELAHEFGLILSGNADVKRAGRKLASLGPGEFFGEMAILDPSPRSATVTSATPCKLVVMHRNDFALVIDTVPAVARKLLAGLARRLRDADRRLIS